MRPGFCIYYYKYVATSRYHGFSKLGMGYSFNTNFHLGAHWHALPDPVARCVSCVMKDYDKCGGFRTMPNVA